MALSMDSLTLLLLLWVTGRFQENVLVKTPGLYKVPKLRNATITTATTTTTTTTATTTYTTTTTTTTTSTTST